jgi:hypothetical protein
MLNAMCPDAAAIIVAYVHVIRKRMLGEFKNLPGFQNLSLESLRRWQVAFGLRGPELPTFFFKLRNSGFVHEQQVDNHFLPRIKLVQHLDVESVETCFGVDAGGDQAAECFEGALARKPRFSFRTWVLFSQYCLLVQLEALPMFTFTSCPIHHVEQTSVPFHPPLVDPARGKSQETGDFKPAQHVVAHFLCEAAHFVRAVWQLPCHAKVLDIKLMVGLEPIPIHKKKSGLRISELRF